MMMTYERATRTLTIETARKPLITTAIRSLEQNGMPVDKLVMDYMIFDELIPIINRKGYGPTVDSGQYQIFGRLRDVEVSNRTMEEIQNVVEIK
jgi:hypothetical protein